MLYDIEAEYRKSLIIRKKRELEAQAINAERRRLKAEVAEKAKQRRLKAEKAKHRRLKAEKAKQRSKKSQTVHKQPARPVRKRPAAPDRKKLLKRNLDRCREIAMEQGFQGEPRLSSRMLMLPLSACRKVYLDYGDSIKDAIFSRNSILLNCEELETAPAEAELKLSSDFKLRIEGKRCKHQVRYLDSFQLDEEADFKRIFAPLLAVMTMPLPAQKLNKHLSVMRKMLIEFELSAAMDIPVEVVRKSNVAEWHCGEDGSDDVPLDLHALMDWNRFPKN